MTTAVSPWEDAVAARRHAAARIARAGPAVDRVRRAPPAYLMTQGSSDLARQCELLTPLPAPGEVRAVCTPARAGGGWHLDIATRDRPGLLAAFTGVLAAQAVDVRQAVLATWDDGGALQAFVVSAPVHLDFASSLSAPLWSEAVADAVVAFDNDGPGLYTGCAVRAADRPGLLHAIAVAIAAAGADVHAARVTTADGIAHDRFDLSDKNGDRLPDRVAHEISALPRAGVPPRTRRWSRRG